MDILSIILARKVEEQPQYVLGGQAPQFCLNHTVYTNAAYPLLREYAADSFIVRSGRLVLPVLPQSADQPF